MADNLCSEKMLSNCNKTNVLQIYSDQYSIQSASTLKLRINLPFGNNQFPLRRQKHIKL